MKFITSNKLNRLWKEGIIANMLSKSRVLKTMEEVEANTNDENVLSAVVGKQIANDLVYKLPNDIKLITEGSGADTKYYAQLGADAASKKLLGSGAELLWTNPSVQSQATIVASCDWSKYDKIIILACEYYGRPSNKFIQCCDIGATTRYWNLSVSGFVVYRTIEFADGCIIMDAETVHNSLSYNIPLKIWGMNTGTDMFSY